MPCAPGGSHHALCPVHCHPDPTLALSASRAPAGIHHALALSASRAPHPSALVPLPMSSSQALWPHAALHTLLSVHALAAPAPHTPVVLPGSHTRGPSRLM